MARYTVHSRPGPEALESAVFVRDGFSFAAFLFGPFWLFAKGAWRAGLFGLAIFALVLIGLALAGLPQGPVLGVFALMHFLIGLEGSTLRRWELRRRGFAERGLVAGGDLDQLEHRFFSEQMAADAALPPLRPAGGTGATGILGLFPTQSGPPGHRS